MLAEWRSGSVSALPCERPGFASRTCLREIIPANNCTMQGQNNWGNWGSLGVMKLLSGMRGASLTNEVPGVMWQRFSSKVSYATLPWFPQCKHSPNWPQIVKIQNGTKCNAIRKSRREAYPASIATLGQRRHRSASSGSAADVAPTLVFRHLRCYGMLAFCRSVTVGIS